MPNCIKIGKLKGRTRNTAQFPCFRKSIYKYVNMSLSRFSDWLKRSSTNEAHNIYGSVSTDPFLARCKYDKSASRSLLAFRSRSICFVRGRLVASLKLYLPDAVLEFKCINGIVPTYLSVHFYRGRLRSGRTTRQSNDRLTVTSLNSELLRVKKSFVYRASNIWNSLCPERKYCMSSFRRIFRHELIYAQY
jgi:hypothetical protein